jgi:hypothetical protein
MTVEGLRRHLAALGGHVDALGPELETISRTGARAHLVAIRAYLDAVLGELEPPPGPAPADDDGPVDAATCLHPEDARRDASSLRHPRRFHCTRCGQLINGD